MVGRIMMRANAPRTLYPGDFAGGRYWLIAPGPMTPKQLVVGSLAAHVATLGKGERVLLDLPQFKQIGLAAFDGEQRFQVLDGGLPECCPADDDGADE